MKKSIFETFSTRFIAWCMILVMAFLSVVSICFRAYIDVTYQEVIHYRNDNIVIAGLFLVLFFVMICFLQKKKMFYNMPEKTVLVVMLVFVTVVSSVWAYASKSFPVADQRWILRCVDGLMKGDYFCMDPASPDGYLQYNRHQVGLTAFLELFTRIFTGGKVNYQAIYALNICMISGIFLGLYLVTKGLTERKDIRIIELLLSFGMIQLMMYSTFVYGLIPGLFFAVYGIYFMLKLFQTKKWYHGCLMALMCALAIVMKSNYLIFLIAIGITVILKAISEKYPVYILYVILAVVCFSGINITAQRVYEKRTGIEFGDTIPNSAYLAMGMKDGPSAPGWFNGFNHVTYRLNGYDEEVTDQISKEYIAERIVEFAENPKECLKFYYKKIVSQWNEVTYECFWISMNEDNRTRELAPIIENLYTGKLHTLVEAVMNLYQMVLFVGTLLCACILRKSKDISKVILLLCVLGGFLFHILWEGKSQYLISYIPLLLPCAAIGIGMLTERIAVKRGIVNQ